MKCWNSVRQPHDLQLSGPVVHWLGQLGGTGVACRPFTGSPNQHASQHPLESRRRTPGIRLPARPSRVGSSARRVAVAPHQPTAPVTNPARASVAAITRRETISNVIASAVIAGLIAWLAFRRATGIEPFAAPPGGVFGIIPGTFNFSLLVTVVLTLILRRRFRGGPAFVTGSGEGSRRQLPANVVVRALVLAAGATLLFVPATMLLIWLGTRAGLLPVTWSVSGMITFFVVYFVLLTWALTPVIVKGALNDIK